MSKSYETALPASTQILLTRPLPELGHRLLMELANAGFAPPSPELQSTYATFRLVTRARLALDHLADPSPRTPEKWPLRAKAYLTEALNS
ncbi:MAG: hypothetical protein ACSHXH_18895 [Marivita sp.]|uniref:hypothetical protein n=1 Tax=Marivita sp. TaxID=2003365 RepID=UPI003EF2F9B2